MSAYDRPEEEPTGLCCTHLESTDSSAAAHQLIIARRSAPRVCPRKSDEGVQPPRTLGAAPSDGEQDDDDDFLPLLTTRLYSTTTPREDDGTNHHSRLPESTGQDGPNGGSRLVIAPSTRSKLTRRALQAHNTLLRSTTMKERIFFNGVWEPSGGNHVPPAAADSSPRGNPPVRTSGHLSKQAGDEANKQKSSSHAAQAAVPQLNIRKARFKTLQQFVDTVKRWPECEDVVIAVPRHTLDPAARFNPYDLVMVAGDQKGHVEGEYVSLSAQGAIYHRPGQPPEFTSFDLWVAEMHALHHLKSLPWLGKFYLWRMFKRLRDNLRSSRYTRQTRRFAKASLLSDQLFISAIQTLRPRLMQISDTPVLDMGEGDTAGWLEDFKEAQEKRRDWLCEQVWRIYNETAVMLMNLSWDLLEREQVIDPADADEMRKAYHAALAAQEEQSVSCPSPQGGKRRREQQQSNQGCGSRFRYGEAQKLAAESLVRWSTAARQRGLCRKLVRLYRLIQQFLDTTLYHLALRSTDELFFLVNTEAVSGAACRAGKHFVRPPNFMHSWCYVDLKLHLENVPGEGPLFSLCPSVDKVVDSLSTMHNAVISICVSLRPLLVSPVLAPFVQMADSVERQIVLPPSQLYTYTSFLDDCVRNAVLLASTSTNWQASSDALSQLNATWVKKVLANQDALIEEYKIRIVDSLCKVYQRLSKRVEKFIAIIEFTREAQAWDPNVVATRIRESLPWSQLVLDNALKAVPQEELAERLYEVNQELSRLQALAKRYTRLEASVDSETNMIQIGPFFLLTTSIKRVLKSTPDSVLYKLRRDLPAIFNSLCSQTLTNAYLVNHKLSRISTTLEQFCEQLHMLDQAEQNNNQFQDEVRILKHYSEFLQSSAFLYNSEANELAHRLCGIEDQLSNTMQTCHTTSLVQMTKFHGQLRQRMDTLHDDVRHLHHTIEDKHIGTELKFDQRERILVVLASLGALKLRVQALQQQARRLITYQEVMSQRQQFVRGEGIKVDSFTDVTELYSRLTGRIRALDRLAKVQATFEKWMHKRLKDVDVNEMSREFGVAAEGFTTDRHYTMGGRLGGLTPDMIKKIKMQLCVIRHLLNTHMSHDNWKHIQRIFISAACPKRGTQRDAGQQHDGEHVEPEGEDQHLRLEESPTLRQLLNPGRLRGGVSIQDVILQASVKELVNSPLMDHIEQLFEISMHASVSGIIKMAIRNTSLCWSKLPVIFRPANSKLFNMTSAGVVAPSSAAGGSDQSLVANDRQLHRALELCVLLHNMLGQYPCSEDNVVGMGLWRNAFIKMRSFLDGWGAVQGHMRQLQQFVVNRETHIALGKEQARSLEHVLGRCLGQLAKVQAHSQLDNLIMHEKDLVDHLPGLLASLEAASRDMRVAICRKRSSCARLYWLQDTELMELYRIWCSTKDSALLPVDMYIQRMFPSLDGLLWQPIEVNSGTDVAAAINANVLGVRSLDGIEDVVFSEHLTRGTSNLESWINTVDERLFDQVYTRVHQTWNQLQEQANGGKDGRWTLPILSEALQSQGYGALKLALSQLLVLQLAWTRDMEENVLSQERPTVAREAMAVTLDFTSKLEKGLWTQSHVQSFYTYAALYLQMVFYRDTASDLFTMQQDGRPLCSSKDDFNWTRHLRYYAKGNDHVGGIGSKKRVVVGPRPAMLAVGLGPLTFDYGYEYRDPRSRLVVPPFTERCLVNLGTAIKQGRMPYVCANDHFCGAPFVAETMAIALGRPHVSFSCSQTVQATSMAHAAQQVIMAGAIVLLENIDRVQESFFPVLVETLQRAREACDQQQHHDQRTNSSEAGGKTAFLRQLNLAVKDLTLLGSTTITAEADRLDAILSVSSPLRSLLPLGSSVNNRASSLPPSLRSFFRPVHLLQPDVSQVFEASFYAYGFPNAPLLAQAMVESLDLRNAPHSTIAIAMGAVRTSFRFTAGRFLPMRLATGPSSREEPSLRSFRTTFFSEVWLQLEQTMPTAQLNRGVLSSRTDFRSEFAIQLGRLQELQSAAVSGQRLLLSPRSSFQGAHPEKYATDANLAHELQRFNMTHLMGDEMDFNTDASWVSTNEELLQLIVDSMENVGMSDVRPQAEAVLQVWRAFQSNSSPCVILTGSPACGKSSFHAILLELIRRVSFRLTEKTNAEGMRRILGHLPLRVVVSVLKAFSRFVRRYKRAKATRRATGSPSNEEADVQLPDEDAAKTKTSTPETPWELIRHGYLTYEDLVGSVGNDGTWSDGLLIHHVRSFARRRQQTGVTRYSTVAELGVEDEYQPPCIISMDGPWTSALEEVLLGCECQPLASMLPTPSPYQDSYRTSNITDQPHHFRLSDGQRVPVPATLKVLIETGSLQSASPASIASHAIVCVQVSACEMCEAMLRSFVRRVRRSDVFNESVQGLLHKLLIRQDHVQAGLAFPESLLHSHHNYKTNFSPTVSTATTVSRVSCFLSLLEYALVHTPAQSQQVNVGGPAAADMDTSTSTSGISATDTRVKQDEALRLNRACSMFLFSYTWGFGSMITEPDDRRAFSELVRERLIPEFGAQFEGMRDPHSNLFDFVLDFSSPYLLRLNLDQPPDWLPSWALERSPMSSHDPRVASELNGHPNRIIFPTHRTLQATAILVYMMKAGRTPVLNGKEGSGKTALIMRLLRALGNDVVEPGKVLTAIVKDPSSFEASEEQVGRRMGTTPLKNMMGSFAHRITEIAHMGRGSARRGSAELLSQSSAGVPESVTQAPSRSLQHADSNGDEDGTRVVRPIEDPLGVDHSYWGNLVSLRMNLDLQRCSSLYVSLDTSVVKDSKDGLRHFLERYLHRERQSILEPPLGVHGIIFVDDVHLATASGATQQTPGHHTEHCQPNDNTSAWRELLRGLIDYQHEYNISNPELVKLSGPFVHAQPSKQASIKGWYYYPCDLAFNRCSLVSAGRASVMDGSFESSACPDVLRFGRHLTPLALDTPTDSEIQQVVSSPIYDSFASVRLENTGAFYDNEINNIVPSLAHFTVNFFDTLSLRLEADQAFALPLLRFDLSVLSRLCRGLALADPVHTPTASTFTRLWLHELLRELYDRLPTHAHDVTDAVLRQMSTHLARAVPLEDSQMAALQLTLAGASNSSLLWTHLSWLHGAHLRPADTSTASAMAQKGDANTHADESPTAYGMRLSYVDVSPSFEDAVGETAMASRETTSDHGDVPSWNESFCFRTRAGQKLVFVKKQAVCSLPALRAVLKDTLTKNTLVPDAWPVTTHIAEQAIRLARLLSVPHGHAILVGDSGRGRHTLVRFVSKLMDVRVMTLDGSRRPRGQREWSPATADALPHPERDWREALRSAVCAVLGLSLRTVTTHQTTVRGSREPTAIDRASGEESIALVVEHAQELQPAAMGAVCNLLNTGDPSFLFNTAELQRMLAALSAKESQPCQGDLMSSGRQLGLMTGGGGGSAGGVTSPVRAMDLITRRMQTRQTSAPSNKASNGISAKNESGSAEEAGQAFNIVAGEQVKAESGLRRVMHALRARLRVFICLDENLARLREDWQDGNSGTTGRLGAVQKCRFLSEFLECHPVLKQKCTALWLRSWSSKDLEEVLQDILHSPPGSSSGGGADGAFISQALSRLSEIGTLQTMRQDLEGHAHGPFFKSFDTEESVQALSQRLYVEWIGAAAAVSVDVHKIAESRVSRLSHSDGLYWESPPRAMLHSLHIFRAQATVASRWYATVHTKVDSALQVLGKLSAEADQSETSLVALQHEATKLQGDISAGNAAIAAITERLQECTLLQRQADVLTLQTQVKNKLAAAEAMSLSVRVELEETRQLLGPLAAQDEYVRMYGTWRDMVMNLRQDPMPDDSAVLSPPSDGGEQSMPTAQLGNPRSPGRVVASKDPLLTTFPRVLQALLLLLAPPPSGGSTDSTTPLTLGMVLDTTLRRRWEQHMLDVSAVETIRELAVLDVSRLPSEFHDMFITLVGSENETWSRSPFKHINVLGHWLQAVRGLFEDQASQRHLEASVEEMQTTAADTEAENRKLKVEGEGLEGDIIKAQGLLAALEGQLSKAQEHIRRLSSVVDQLNKVKVFLKDATTVCEERRSALERSVVRFPGDLFLFCVATHYLGECAWPARLEILKAWRQACWDHHGVPTSSADDILGVISDPVQCRHWTFNIQDADNRLYEPLLPHHPSWLSSAAFVMACAGWPLMVDPMSERPSLSWLQSIHLSMKVKLFVIPAMHVTRVLLERVVKYRDNDHQGAALAVTDLEAGVSTDLLRLLTSRLTRSDSQLACHMDGAQAPAMILPSHFRLYLLTSVPPLRTSDSLVFSNRYVTEPAADAFLANDQLQLPASAMKNLCIVQFGGESRTRYRKIRLHAPPPESDPIRTQSSHGQAMISSSLRLQRPQREQHRSTTFTRQLYNARTELSAAMDSDRACALAQSIAYSTLQQAWDSADRQVRGILRSPTRVAHSYRMLRDAEESLIAFILSLEGPCATGWGVIHKAPGGEELTVDTLRLLRVNVARAQVELRGALLSEARAVAVWQSLRPLASHMISTSNNVREALRVHLQSGMAGSLPAIGLLASRDEAGAFARALPQRGSPGAKALQVVTARAGRIERFSPVLLHARRFLTKFRQRRASQSPLPLPPTPASTQPALIKLVQPPSSKVPHRTTSAKLRSVTRFIRLRSKKPFKSGSSPAGANKMTHAAALVGGGPATEHEAEQDALVAGFPDNVLEGIYRRSVGPPGMLSVCIPPECQWVVTMTLVYSMHCQRWDLGEESFFIFLTQLRGANASGPGESTFFCAGKEGYEYVWLHEDILGSQKKSIRPADAKERRESADGEKAIEAADVKQEDRPTDLGATCSLLQGLGRAESYLGPSSSDEDESGDEDDSQEQEGDGDHDCDEGDEAFDVIEEGEEHDVNMPDGASHRSAAEDDEEPVDQDPSISLGKFKARQLRVATVNLLSGGSFALPPVGTLLLPQRLYGLVQTTREYLDKQPLPQILRRHPHGRHIWRYVCILEHWVPHVFTGLGQSLITHGKRWEAWKQQLQERFGQAGDGVPQGDPSTAMPPPPTWKGAGGGVMDPFHQVLLAATLEPGLLPTMVTLYLNPFLSGTVAMGDDDARPVETGVTGDGGGAAPLERAIRATGGTSCKPILLAQPSSISNIMCLGAEMGKVQHTHLSVHQPDPVAHLNTLAVKERVPLLVVAGLAGAASSATESRQVAALEDAITNGKWLIVVGDNLSSPTIASIIAALRPGSLLRPDDLGFIARLLALPRHPNFRLFLTAAMDHTFLTSPWSLWVQRSSVVLWSVRDQPSASDLGPAVTATARLASTLSGLSSSDPFNRVICKVYLSIERLLACKSGRYMQSSDDVAISLLPALLLYAQSAIVPCLARLEHAAPQESLHGLRVLLMQCRALIDATYGASLPELPNGGPASQSTQEEMLEAIAQLLFKGLRSRFLPSNPVEPQLSPITEQAPSELTTSELNEEGLVLPSMPLTISTTPLEATAAERPPSPSPAIPRPPNEARPASIRQPPPFIFGLRVNSTRQVLDD